VNAPRVVALVPTWRASEFIDQTLRSLAAQTWSHLEILISDDASPDDTAAKCERFATADPRFRVIRQPRNLGWVGNVNALLNAARGDYLLFAFQDDLPEPAYIEKCVAALEANPRAIIAYSDIALVNQDGSREEKRYAELDGVSDRLERGRRVAWQEGSWWIPNRGVFRSRAAAEIGGLRRHAAGEFSADWPWLLHMTLLGEGIRVPERLVTKIYMTRSLSRSWNFGGRSWTAVTLSAAGAVWRADIPLHEKIALMPVLTGFLFLRVRRAARLTIGRTLRRLGLRRSADGAATTASARDAGRATD
jgi:glycosyltransferase involved in cell wall biosynthesis